MDAYFIVWVVKGKSMFLGMVLLGWCLRDRSTDPRLRRCGRVFKFVIAPVGECVYAQVYHRHVHGISLRELKNRNAERGLLENTKT